MLAELQLGEAGGTGCRAGKEAPQTRSAPEMAGAKTAFGNAAAHRRKQARSFSMPAAAT